MKKFFPDRKRVRADGNTLHIYALERHTDLRSLNFYCDRILGDQRIKELRFIFENDFRIFPNMMAPLAAILCFLEEVNVKVKVESKHLTIHQCRAFEPVRALPTEARADPSNVVWEYRNAEELEFLIEQIIPLLYRQVESQKNVLLALEYCLSEMMDNVQRHSGERCGFMMYSLQSEQGRVAISIADQGKGIKSSFKNTKYRPIRASDAISLAMQIGVTSSPEGAGNGLWTTTELITANSGRLTITSGGGAIFYNRNLKRCESFDDLHTIDPYWPGTHVDFQLDFSSTVDFASIWGDLPAPINIRSEHLEDSDNRIVINVAEQSFGTSTRKSGSEMRVLASNMLRTEGQDVVLDFSGISMISSSFADEAVGKVLVDTSINNSRQRLKTHGTSSTIDLIINDVVRSRTTR